MRWNATSRPPASHTATLTLMLSCFALAIAPPAMRLASSRVSAIGSSLSRYQTEALRLHAEGRVEFTAEVFERHRSGQFDDLCFGVVTLQSGEEFVIDFLIGVGDPL